MARDRDSHQGTRSGGTIERLANGILCAALGALAVAVACIARPEWRSDFLPLVEFAILVGLLIGFVASPVAYRAERLARSWWHRFSLAERLANGVITAAFGTLAVGLICSASPGWWPEFEPLMGFAVAFGLLFGFVASRTWWSRFTTWLFAHRQTRTSAGSDSRSVGTLLRPMRPAYRLVLACALVLSGATCTALGLLVLFPEQLTYRDLASNRMYTEWTFYPDHLPDDRFVSGPWRTRHNLPPRRHVSTIDLDTLYWLRMLEPELWMPAEAEDRWTPRVSAKHVAIMLEQRAGAVLTAPDAFAPLRIAGLAATLLAIATFVLLAGAVRIWLLLPVIEHRPSRAHLLSSTAFAACILCVAPRLLFHFWLLGHPPFGLLDLLSFRWEPWSYAGKLLAAVSVPAAWSVATAVLCWFGVAWMASALNFAGRYSPLATAYSARYLRLALWSLPLVCAAYTVLSVQLGRPIVPQMLLPWWVTSVAW